MSPPPLDAHLAVALYLRTSLEGTDLLHRPVSARSRRPATRRVGGLLLRQNKVRTKFLPNHIVSMNEIVEVGDAAALDALVRLLRRGPVEQHHKACVAAFQVADDLLLDVPARRGAWVHVVVPESRVALRGEVYQYVDDVQLVVADTAGEDKLAGGRVLFDVVDQRVVIFGLLEGSSVTLCFRGESREGGSRVETLPRRVPVPNDENADAGEKDRNQDQDRRDHSRPARDQRPVGYRAEGS